MFSATRPGGSVSEHDEISALFASVEIVEVAMVEIRDDDVPNIEDDGANVVDKIKAHVNADRGRNPEKEGQKDQVARDIVREEGPAETVGPPVCRVTQWRSCVSFELSITWLSLRIRDSQCGSSRGAGVHVLQMRATWMAPLTLMRWHRTMYVRTL